MDSTKIVDLLRSTNSIHALQRGAAEKQLKQIEQMKGFAPAILQIVMSNNIDMDNRQAGAIYLKHLIRKYWDVPDGAEIPCMNVEDRTIIRDSLVNGIIYSPLKLQSQFCTFMRHICYRDSCWPLFANSISNYLNKQNVESWQGALTGLLVLTEIFSHKKGEERVIVHETMHRILPLVQQMMVDLMTDGSEKSFDLQHIILKIYFSLIHSRLPFDLLTTERCSALLEFLHLILDRNNTEFEKPTNDEEVEILKTSPWWKTKKWAIRILFKIFHRYGSPGHVTKTYKRFAVWYIDNFSARALQVVFKILDSFRKKEFVHKKVLRVGLMYLRNAVRFSTTWEMMKPHVNALVSDVIYPLMCHSEADEMMWKDNPIEFIRATYGYSTDENCVTFCAVLLLHSVCEKDKDVLTHCLQLITQILNYSNSTHQQKDGALYMIGAVADILLKTDQYKNDFENLLKGFVFPLFASPVPYLRSRALWLLSKLCILQFSEATIVQEATQYLLASALNTQEDLPVRIQSGLAIEAFIHHQKGAHCYFQPHARQLTMNFLELVRTTEYEDLTGVLRKLLWTFINEVSPCAQEISFNLANTFMQAVSNGTEGKFTTLVSIIKTMEDVLSVLDGYPELVSSLEPVYIQVIKFIFDEGAESEFYEEAFALTDLLTESQISPAMWSLYEDIYRVVERDGSYFFVKMMPALYNYIVVDTDAFLSNNNRLLAMCSVIKEALLNDDYGEEVQMYAGKLIEVLILHCGHRIQNFIPGLLQLILERLSRIVEKNGLTVSCLQVIIASLYHDMALTMSVVPMEDIIKLWMSELDWFYGKHNQKLCVLGFCTLLQNQNRPSALQEYSKDILPSMISLLASLAQIYDEENEQEGVDGEEDDDDDENCEIDLEDSEEDDIDDDSGRDEVDVTQGESSVVRPDEMGDETDEGDSDDEFSDTESCVDEYPLEFYVTPIDAENSIDEYVLFKEVLMNLQKSDPAWYTALTNDLNEQQRKSIEGIFTVADQRRDAVLSKQLVKKTGPECEKLTSGNIAHGSPTVK